MLRFIFSYLFTLILLSANLLQTAHGQREILPLALDKLNRDSLNKVIRQKEKEKDYQALGDIYGGIYCYFFQTKFRDSTIFYADKAEQYFYMAGDSAKYYLMELRHAELSIYSNNIDLAKSYLEKVKKYSTRIKNYQLLTHTYGLYLYLNFSLGDTITALKYYSQVLKQIKKLRTLWLILV